jgi:hypothetical protein
LYSEAVADIDNLPANAPEAPDPVEDFRNDNQFAYASEAVLDEEFTSNVLGEAVLGEIILQ